MVCTSPETPLSRPYPGCRVVIYPARCFALLTACRLSGRAWSVQGISGLLPMLKEISNPIHIKEWKGKTLAVDGYVS